MRVATDSSVSRLLRMTLPLAQPAVAARAALHHRMIAEPGNPDAPPAVIATMNADSRQIGIDYLFAETLANLYDHAIRWTKPLQSRQRRPAGTRLPAGQRRLPELPVPHTLPRPHRYRHSRTGRLRPGADRRLPALTRKPNRKPTATPMPKKRRKAASDDIKRIPTNRGLTEYRHTGDQPLTAKLSVTNTYGYDRKVMTRLLTPDQLSEVISERPSHRISITLPKRG